MILSFRPYTVDSDGNKVSKFVSISLKNRGMNKICMPLQTVEGRPTRRQAETEEVGKAITTCIQTPQGIQQRL